MWTNDELVMDARLYALILHSDQSRKYSGEPYFNHLEEVARLVYGVNGTPAMVAAAFLHDSIEDQGETTEGLTELFGQEVATLVDWLTDRSIFLPQPRPNRKERKRIDREWTFASPPEAKTIKLADLISNTRSIVQNDPNFARVYLREKRLLMEGLTEGNEILYNYAMRILTGAEKALEIS